VGHYKKALTTQPKQPKFQVCDEIISSQINGHNLFHYFSTNIYAKNGHTKVKTDNQSKFKKLKIDQHFV